MKHYLLLSLLIMLVLPLQQVPGASAGSRGLWLIDTPDDYVRIWFAVTTVNQMRDYRGRSLLNDMKEGMNGQEFYDYFVGTTMGRNGGQLVNQWKSILSQASQNQPADATLMQSWVCENVIIHLGRYENDYPPGITMLFKKTA